jgi:4-hydroxythreonine-4-phosphate dehydrogenase
MGDPGGIGPELVVRVLADAGTYRKCQPLVVGDARVIAEHARRAGIDTDVREIRSAQEVASHPGRIDVMPAHGRPLGAIAWGQVDRDAGRLSLACLERAAELGVSGEIDGIVSAPLHKEALRLAGMTHADELGLLAELTGSSTPLLVGVLGELWTTCVTLHVPLRAVPNLITPDRVLTSIEALATALPGERRYVAVAALNPHAGEGGLLGREEIDAIAPAIAAARAAGLNVVGPLPADTLFPSARALGVDGVVCMYHDQANIARKLTGWRGQATLFLGLPVPVATTAHGTAFDRAGLGTADPASLVSALDETVRIAMAVTREAERARG